MAARRHQRLDPGSRSQEDGQIEGQRSDAPWPAGGIRLRRDALLGGEWSAGYGHRLRHRPDEDRPSTGDQVAQRESLCTRVRYEWRPGDRATRPSLARRTRPGHRGGDCCPHRLPVHPGTRVDRIVLLALLRRLHRVGQGARERSARRGWGGVGKNNTDPLLVGPTSTVRTVPSLRYRGGLVVVAGGQHPSRRLASGVGGRRPRR